MSSVPSIWKTILKIAKPLKNNTIELVTCGSAPLSSSLWNEIQQWTGISEIWNTYGITETGSWIAGTNIDNFTPQNGMIGYGWGANILISEKDSVDSCSSRDLHEYRALSPNEVGYIWVQTASLMDGYLNQKKMTDDVVSGSWFFTGDLGYMDDKGVLFISGRVRNEINTGGIKVIPEDIDFLLEGHNEVVESCVFGLDDDLMGEIIAVAIVINSKSSITSAELVEWCSKEVSDYKIPKVWYFIDEIPKTTRGKISRDLVSEYCKSL
jgi:acyl-CoA synthetase (AMP-forming)/AMP-acid ligase II